MRLSHFKRMDKRWINDDCYICDLQNPTWNPLYDPSLIAVFPQRYREGEVKKWEVWLASHTDDLRSHRHHITVCLTHAEEIYLLWEAMVAAELLEAMALDAMYARGERL